MLTAIIIIAAVLLFLTLLLLVPIHLTAEIDSGARIFLRVLFFRKKLYPTEKKPKNKSEKKKPKPAGPPEKKKEPDIAGTIRIFSETLSVLFEKLADRLKIKLKRYNVTIGTDEAARTAMLCAAAEQASGFLLALLYSQTRFSIARGCTPRVTPDFVTCKCTADIRIVFTINPLGILATLIPTVRTYQSAVRSAAKKSGTAENPENEKNHSGQKPGKGI